MRIISVPMRLRAASALLFLAVPVAVIQAVVLLKAPWWRLPYRTLGMVAAVVFLACIPLAIGLLKARKWVIAATAALGAAWVLISFLAALKAQSPALGFVALLVVGFAAGLLVWLNREVSRSFLDPQLRWFQGLPKPIPGLACELAQGERRTPVRVSRLDRDGVFVFCEQGAAAWGTEPVSLVFRFKSREIPCNAVPMSYLDRGNGGGFRFSGMTPDSRKELGDLIEFLRGEGYVE